MADRHPPIPREFLEWLEKKYPERIPSIGDTNRQIWINVGHAEVIRHLRHLYEQQTKDNKVL